jgi:nicotinate-nucleotide adenylyltransferase
MVRLAVAGEPGLEACDLEVERGGRSYTAETMDELGRRYPDRSFVLLLGYDAALGIGGWRDARRLLSSTPIVVFNRSGTTPPSSARLGRLGFDLERTRLIEIDSPSIAAHELRDRLRRRQPVDGLVPEAVADYIREHRLYREGVG